jgi:hypothetical protein
MSSSGDGQALREAKAQQDALILHRTFSITKSRISAVGVEILRRGWRAKGKWLDRQSGAIKEICMTQQTVPDLSSDYSITPEQIAEYREKGHILLRGVCTPEEIAYYRPLFLQVVEEYARKAKRLEERDTYGKAFLQIGFVGFNHEALKPFSQARRFARIATELMGADGARLYHDQALYKEAGGGHTPWHQDQNYWPFDAPQTVTMWMPLVDISPEMGTMTFASGSHRQGSLTELLISDESDARYRQIADERSYAIEQTPAMRAGDATFHAGWTLHGAPGNSSDRMREVMTIIYFADGLHTINPINSHARQADFDGIFPGGTPGERAVSKFTPLLYSKG